MKIIYETDKGERFSSEKECLLHEGLDNSPELSQEEKLIRRIAFQIHEIFKDGNHPNDCGLNLSSWKSKESEDLLKVVFQCVENSDKEDLTAIKDFLMNLKHKVPYLKDEVLHRKYF